MEAPLIPENSIFEPEVISKNLLSPSSDVLDDAELFEILHYIDTNSIDRVEGFDIATVLGLNELNLQEPTNNKHIQQKAESEDSGFSETDIDNATVDSSDLQNDDIGNNTASVFSNNSQSNKDLKNDPITQKQLNFSLPEDEIQKSSLDSDFLHNNINLHEKLSHNIGLEDDILQNNILNDGILQNSSIDDVLHFDNVLQHNDILCDDILQNDILQDEDILQTGGLFADNILLPQESSFMQNIYEVNQELNVAKDDESNNSRNSKRISNKIYTPEKTRTVQPRSCRLKKNRSFTNSQVKKPSVSVGKRIDKENRRYLPSVECSTSKFLPNNETIDEQLSSTDFKTETLGNGFSKFNNDDNSDLSDIDIETVSDGETKKLVEPVKKLKEVHPNGNSSISQIKTTQNKADCNKSKPSKSESAAAKTSYPVKPAGKYKKRYDGKNSKNMAHNKKYKQKGKHEVQHLEKLRNKWNKVKSKNTLTDVKTDKESKEYSCKNDQKHNDVKNGRNTFYTAQIRNEHSYCTYIKKENVASEIESEDEEDCLGKSKNAESGSINAASRNINTEVRNINPESKNINTENKIIYNDSSNINTPNPSVALATPIPNQKEQISLNNSQVTKENNTDMNANVPNNNKNPSDVVNKIKERYVQQPEELLSQLEMRIQSAKAQQVQTSNKKAVSLLKSNNLPNIVHCYITDKISIQVPVDNPVRKEINIKNIQVIQNSRCPIKRIELLKYQQKAKIEGENKTGRIEILLDTKVKQQAKRKLNLSEYKLKKPFVQSANSTPSTSTNTSPIHVVNIGESFDENTARILGQKSPDSGKIELLETTIPPANPLTPEKPASPEKPDSPEKLVNTEPKITYNCFINTVINFEILEKLKHNIKFNSHSLLSTVIETQIAQVPNPLEDDFSREDKTIHADDKKPKPEGLRSIAIQTDEDPILGRFISYSNSHIERENYLHTPKKRSRSTSRSISSRSSYSRSPSPRRKRKMFDLEQHTKDVNERQVIYIGSFNKVITSEWLAERYCMHGKIKRVSSHKKLTNNGMMYYGFITYHSKKEALRCYDMEAGKRGEHELFVGFGGRRLFCGGEYIDLDNATDCDNRMMQEQEMSFEALLSEYKALKRT